MEQRILAQTLEPPTELVRALTVLMSLEISLWVSLNSELDAALLSFSTSVMIESAGVCRETTVSYETFMAGWYVSSTKLYASTRVIILALDCHELQSLRLAMISVSQFLLVNILFLLQ